MRWARSSKRGAYYSALAIVAIAMIMVTILLGILTACQSDNNSGIADDDINTEDKINTDSNNSNDSSTDSNNSNDNNADNNNPNDDMSNIKYIYAIINDNRLEIELSRNIAVNALLERLKEGNITYTARDYGGFEKVGSIGVALPTSDTNINAEAGDVMLYQGNQIVMFYGENRYSYTRIGRIKGYSIAQLKSILNAEGGNIEVTLSLN